MLLDLYHAQCVREEYERRARAYRLARAALEARADRAVPITQLLAQRLRRVVNLTKEIGRWLLPQPEQLDQTKTQPERQPVEQPQY